MILLLYNMSEPYLLRFSTQAHMAGLYGSEVTQAIRFLHELGTIQHFNNDFLKNKVVINPQWIVDVMACVVSVHNKVTTVLLCCERWLGDIRCFELCG